MRLVGYLRVSTDRQAEQGLGLQVQERAIRAWGNRNGHRIVALHRDEGISGANGIDTRRGLYDALDALEGDQADGIVLYNLDRLARRLDIQEGILGRVWEKHRRVFTVEEDGEVLEDDPDDPMRTAMRQVRGVFAQLERAMIAKRMRDGRRLKAEQGGYAFGAPPFGTRTDDGILVADQDEQAIVNLIVRERRAGASYRQIIATLEQHGHRPRRAEQWSPATIRKIAQRAGSA